MLKGIILVGGILLSSVCMATDAIYCNPGKVLNIQSQTGNVVIQVSGLGWQQLGLYSDPIMNSRLSIALAAQASGKDLMLAFPLGSNVVCTNENWSVSPYKVRITN